MTVYEIPRYPTRTIIYFFILRYHFDDDIGNHNTSVRKNECETPFPWEIVVIPGYENKCGEKDAEERHPGDDEGGREVHNIGFSRLANDVCARNADAQQDVEHRTAKAGSKTHDRG